MSENHATPQPTPKSLCALFEPMLPLLHADGLTDAERASLEEHLADCAWCQNRLATLDVVDAALRRHYASVPAATTGSGPRPRVRPALSLEDIMKADQEETKTATTPHRPPTPIRQLTPRQRRLTALGALAAVLVLAVLAASLFSYLGRTPTHVATPTAVPQPTAPAWPTVAPSTLKGTVTEFAIPTPNAKPNYITAGPDGNLWFTEGGANKIGKITPQGHISEFSVPTANSGLTAITAGADGNLWFTETTANQIGRITPQGSVAEFAVPTAGSQPEYLAKGSDGNVWFTETAGNKIGRITPHGAFNEFAIPSANSQPSGITAGGDGNIWFVEYNTTTLAKITPQGSIKEYPVVLPGAAAQPGGSYDYPSMDNPPILLAWGPDDALWWNIGFEDSIGFMTPQGAQPAPAPGLNPKHQGANCPNGARNTFAGQDRSLWLSMDCTVLARLTLTSDAVPPFGTFTSNLYPLPQDLGDAAANGRLFLAPLADGTVWFVGASANVVGHLT